MNTLDKYNAAAKIAKQVYNELVTKIKGGERNVEIVNNFGEELIKSECEKIYKKEKIKGVGFPVSISLNNCVENYVYDEKILLYSSQQIPNNYRPSQIWVDKPNPNLPSNGCNGKRTISVQCNGFTLLGLRCKNSTLSCNGYCYLHGGN